MINIKNCFDLGDRVIQSMVDYIGWTAEYNHSVVTHLRTNRIRTDNGSFIELFWFTVSLEWLFPHDTYMITVSHMGHSLPIARLKTTNIGWNIILKWDVYGKWLVYLRDTVWSFTRLSRLFHVFGVHDLILTRYDHCADTIHTWFRRAAQLRKWIRTDTRDPHYEKGKLTYVRYWSRRASQFYRVYDKSFDLECSGHSRLYPEYENKRIMRYEVQVTSKWISPLDKKITVDDLELIANHALTIAPDRRYRKTDKIYQWLRDSIVAIRKEGDFEQLLWLRHRLFNQVILIEKQLYQQYRFTDRNFCSSVYKYL